MKASVHLLASQLMRSWNRGVLLCFRLAHHTAFSLESGHRVKMERRVQDSFMCLLVVVNREIPNWLFFSSVLPVCVPSSLFWHLQTWWVVCCSQAKHACKLLSGTSKCRYKTPGDCLCSLSCFKNLCHLLCLCSYIKAELGNNVGHQIRCQKFAAE